MLVHLHPPSLEGADKPRGGHFSEINGYRDYAGQILDQGRLQRRGHSAAAATTESRRVGSHGGGAPRHRRPREIREPGVNSARHERRCAATTRQRPEAQQLRRVHAGILIAIIIVYFQSRNKQQQTAVLFRTSTGILLFGFPFLTRSYVGTYFTKNLNLFHTYC